MKRFKEMLPGLFFATALAIVATFLGKLAPIIGGPVFGIVLGILISSIWGKPKTTKQGLTFASKKILQWSIIALGGGLSLTQVYKVGVSSLYVMIFTLTTAFITAYGIGKLMRIPIKLTSLIGMGTAICGGSAIAAISPIIEAEDEEIAYSISTVFIFNVIAVLIFPPLGHLLGLTDNAFGLFAGTAINDTSSVVAAGYAFSNAAGAYATIVKLTRTTMIIPISLIFAAVVSIQKKREANKRGGEVNYSFKKIFPWFIVWFLAASLLNTVGVINGQMAGFITEVGKFFIVVALAAIGLNSDLKQMLRTGFKPMLLGLVVWASVTIVSLIVQFSSGQI
ncbi:YeiH family protein [Acetivibrio cellulolyticus]|uniref:YeiH family protein n=1 Tax=Acetivibrio cellulolyticus TaxID=35830 RepID=UPI0001E2D117|nr:YeiH family protein [Acetivibrio cellulolyticus]